MEHNKKITSQANRLGKKVCDVFEMILAVLVGIAVVVAIIGLVPSFATFIHHGADSHAFMEVLEEIFSIAVGIEFLKMLCKPNPENTIEVLIFLVARHMVIGANSALDNLLSIIGICLLFLVDLYMRRFFGVEAAKAEFSAKDDEAEEES